MEDLPPKGLRKSSSKTSLDREESWRRKPVKKRKKTLELAASGADSPPNPFTTSVGRHSLYSSSSNKGASAKAASQSKAEKNLDNPKASQSHRRSKSAASLLSSKLQVYRLVFPLNVSLF